MQEGDRSARRGACGGEYGLGAGCTYSAGPRDSLVQGEDISAALTRFPKHNPVFKITCINVKEKLNGITNMVLYRKKATYVLLENNMLSDIEI